MKSTARRGVRGSRAGGPGSSTCALAQPRARARVAAVPGIARLALTALDCEDPHELGGFYSALTGWPVEPDEDNEEWVQLASDGPVTLAFQRVEDYEPPVWPGSDAPQQLHLDFEVPDLDEGERRVLEIGAVLADYQPGETFRVFLDPAGHPFCLVLAG